MQNGRTLASSVDPLLKYPLLHFNLLDLLQKYLSNSRDMVLFL